MQSRLNSEVLFRVVNSLKFRTSQGRRFNSFRILFFGHCELIEFLTYGRRQKFSLEGRKGHNIVRLDFVKVFRNIFTIVICLGNVNDIEA